MTRLFTTRKYDGLKVIIVALMTIAAGFIAWVALR